MLSYIVAHKWECVKLKKDSFAAKWTVVSSSSDCFYFSAINKELGSQKTGPENLDLAWLIENTYKYDSSNATQNTYGSYNYGYWTLSPVSDKVQIEKIKQHCNNINESFNGKLKFRDITEVERAYSELSSSMEIINKAINVDFNEN